MTSPEPPNPYAPPTAILDADAPGVVAGAAVSSGELASRWRRLGGAMVDGLLGTIAIAPSVAGLSSSQIAAADKGGILDSFFMFTQAGTPGLVALVLWVALTILQWALLARRGQTLGKMLVGTRVMRVDDLPAGFFRAVALRAWPLEIVSRLPVVRYLTLVDVLFIFGAERRCFHDRIAGTKVVRASAAS